jgi:NDP-sugar pyrophosphorylase family protein
MKAVILIGGKALRLRPLTFRRPKAIVPLLTRPFLVTQFELLRRAGITDVILCLASLPRRIEATFGDGNAFGVSLRYSVEPKPLGTGGAIGHVRSLLREPFVCLNGDSLTDLDVGTLVRTHESAQAVLTLALTPVADTTGYGVVRTEPSEAGGTPRVTEFTEKPETPGPGEISVGAYVMDPAIFEFLPDKGPCSLEHEVFPAALAAGRRVAAHRHAGYFTDIGVLPRYRQAHRDALDGKIRIPGVGRPNPGGVIVDETASVHPRARLTGPALVGPDAQVREDAEIGPYAVLGRHVLVEARARVSDSILWAHTRVSEDASVSGTILGVSSFVGPGARLSRAVLGDKSTVAAHSTVPWPAA